MLRRALSDVPGVQVLDAGPTQSAIVVAEIAGTHASEVARALHERRVNTSVTLQWYGLRDLGERNVQSALRVSPHYYNTEAEVREAVDHVRAALHRR
jgi:selenocysteine lyase/cysteine desulfurase